MNITRLLTLTLILTSINCYSQVTNGITFSKKSNTVKEIIEKIKLEGYNIAYNDDIIPFSRKVVISKNRLSISAALDALCGDDLTYEIQGTSIYLNKQPPPTQFTISGTVRNAENGETLIGAHVSLQNNQKGVVTNSYGFFSLTLSKGIYILRISYTGFHITTDTIDLSSNTNLKAFLTPNISRLPEVVVIGKEPMENLTSPLSGKLTLNPKVEGEIPYFLGEVDVLQESLLFPGITNLGEDSNGINVRGGSADQNLILLDEATIYNSSHFYGLVSVFNPESVNDVEIMKGSIPARYGGRNSSVINIRQREGNYQNFQLSGGIGLVAARITGEGPINDGKGSFLIAGRRSILNLALRNIDFENLGRNRANFEDLNFKINYAVNSKNRLFLSGYYGNDRNETGLETFRRWGNRTLTFRWNRIISDKLFSNYSAIVSQYSYRVTDLREVGSFIGNSQIINYSLKADFTHFTSLRHKTDFGGGINLQRLNPGDRQPLPSSGSTNPVSLDTEHGLSPYLYAEHEVDLNKVKLTLGLRGAYLMNLGKGEVYQYGGELKSRDNITDTTHYESMEIINTHFGLEPRVSLNFKLNETSTIKASYISTVQYLHLISNTLSPSPTDIWKLSDTHINPTRSNQYSLGLYKNFNQNKIESSIEGYYRKLKNVIEFKPNADLELNEVIETEILDADGRTYGLEFLLRKKTGKFNGWVSYSISRSERRINSPVEELNINDGKYFPSNFDQTHQFSTTGIFEITRRLSASANFIFATGKPITLPSDVYEFNGIVVPHFTERNQDRLPDYHRLDISVKLMGRRTKKDGSPKRLVDYWTFSVYNLYSRSNAFSYVYRESESDPTVTEIIPYSILPSAIPAITYNFRW